MKRNANGVTICGYYSHGIVMQQRKRVLKYITLKQYFLQGMGVILEHSYSGSTYELQASVT